MSRSMIITVNADGKNIKFLVNNVSPFVLHQIAGLLQIAANEQIQEQARNNAGEDPKAQQAYIAEKFEQQSLDIFFQQTPG